jgi:hypothetical protein
MASLIRLCNIFNTCCFSELIKRLCHKILGIFSLAKLRVCKTSTAASSMALSVPCPKNNSALLNSLAPQRIKSPIVCNYLIICSICLPMLRYKNE